MSVDWSQFTPIEDQPTTPAAVDWSKFTALGPNDDTSVVRPTPDPSPIAEFIGQLRSGWESATHAGTEAINRAIGPALPGEDDEAQRIAQSQRRQAQLAGPAAQSTIEGEQAINDATGPLDFAKQVIAHPRGAIMETAQSVGSSAQLAPTMALGPLMPVGQGLGSYAQDYQSTMEGVLQNHGVDITDPVAVREALDNPEIISDARRQAHAHAVPVSLFDALTAHLAGHLLAGATGKLSAAARAAGEVGMQAAGGAAGEYTGEKAAGQDTQWGNIGMEAFGEIAGSPQEIATNYREARDAHLERQARLSQGDSNLASELAQQDLGQLSPQDIASTQRDVQGPTKPDRYHVDVGSIQSDYIDLANQYGAKITSLRRSPQHNAEVGGVPDSQHIAGTAGDFVVPADQKEAFRAAAHARGYQTIDEGDHIHVQLPHGTRIEPSTTTTEVPSHLAHTEDVTAREQARAQQVEQGTLSQGTAVAENALDQARKDRGLPLEPNTPATPTMDRQTAIATANDPTKTPEERRAAKSLAQQQDANQSIGEGVRQLAQQMLDRSAQQTLESARPLEPAQNVPQQAPEGLAPATAQTPAPITSMPIQPVRPDPLTQMPQQAAPVEPQQAPEQPPPAQVGTTEVAPTAPPAQPETQPLPLPQQQATPPIDEQATTDPAQAPDQQMGQQANELGGDMPALSEEEGQNLTDKLGTPQPPPGVPGEIPRTPVKGGKQMAVATRDAGTTMAEAIRQALNRAPHMLHMLHGTVEGLHPTQELQPGQVEEVKLAPVQQKKIDLLGKLLGRKIVLFDIKARNSDQLGGFALDDRHIFISVQQLKTGLGIPALIGHEFTHTLRKEGSALLEQLIAEAKRQLNVNSKYSQGMIATYVSLYQHRFANPKDLTDKVVEEFVADLIGDILNTDTFWNNMAESNPGLFRKTLKSLITFLRNLGTRAARLGSDDAFNDIEKMRAKATDLLQKHIKAEAMHPTLNTAEAAVAGKPDAAITGTDQNSRRDLVIERGTRLAHAAFEKGDYMSAARHAADVSTDHAPPLEIKTPEQKAFFKDSSTKVNRRNEAGVYFHGTARDITRFRPKQGDAVFLADRAGFSAPYTATSQAHMKANGSHDILVDGKSMRQQMKETKAGTLDNATAELMLRFQGNPEAALNFIHDHGYSYISPGGYTVEEFNNHELQELDDALNQIGYLSEENPSFIKAHLEQGEAAPAGMNIMPLATNAKNPFDFQERGHVSRLMNELRDKYKTPGAFSKAMDHPHYFQTWDDVREAIEGKSGTNWTVLEDRGGGIPQLLKEMGFDSYFVAEEGDKNLAVFDPKQVKSIHNAGPWGTRKPTAEEAASLGMTLEEAIAAQDEGDIRLAVNGGPRNFIDAAVAPNLQQAMHNTWTALLNDDHGMWKQIQRWVLDQYVDLKDIQKAIADNVFGGRLPTDFNAHQIENLRHGAYKDASEKAHNNYIAPIARHLSRIGASLDEFSDFLWWRHAPERDAYLRSKLDPQLAAQVGPADLAGISPADAQRNIANLDPAKRHVFERLAKIIDSMRKFTLDTQLKSGQITQEFHDNLLRQYQHYVPLRDRSGHDGSAIVNQYGSGKGMNMSRNPIGPRAMGRKTKPENIIEEMMRDMDNALIGVQKQGVLSSLVRLIAANPDPDLWEVQPVTAERKWVDGVLTVVQANGQPKDQITFMHNGIPVKIEIRHEGLRKAMLNLHQPMPGFIRTLGRATRWLSAVKTSFSPFFLLANPVRDAGLAIMGVGAEHGMAALKSMAKFYPHTYTALSRDEGKHPQLSRDPVLRQLQQYAREFASTGGKTGYTYVSDIRDMQKKLSHLMDFYSDSKGMKDILAGNVDTKDAALILRKGWQHIGRMFETMNDLSENSTRLAVYAAMRDNGMSIEDAATYAKEVTVNFNRKGSLASSIGSMYMFFNAAVQSGARLTKLMGNKKFAATMGGLFAASYVMALGQMIGAGDDDDGESKYDKAISDQQSQRMLSIYLGNGKSFAFPVPYGPNIFTYAGYRMAKFTYDQMQGKNPEVGTVAGDMLQQTIMAMSPIDPGKGFGAVLPEFMRVPYQALANKSDFGGPINAHIDPRDRTDTPNFYKTDTKTSPLLRMVAAGFNLASGGNDYEAGKINVSGEQVGYVGQQLTGGMGRLAIQSADLFQNIFDGIDPDPSDIPLANVYFRGRGSKMVDDSYYRNLDDYDKSVAMWKLAVANGDTAEQERILKHAPWVHGAEEDASTTEGRQAQEGTVMDAKRGIDRQMKELRKQKSAVLADDTLSRRDKKQRAYAIDQQIAELEKDFNYAINSGRGYPSTQR